MPCPVPSAVPPLRRHPSPLFLFVPALLTPCGMDGTHDGSLLQPDEETALLRSPDRKALKTPTPLPRLQIFILLLMQLAEPITSNCIYPFINQVRHYTASSPRE